MMERAVEVNGIRLAVWERPGRGTPLLLVHATGFHGRCWDQIVARIPDRHCFAVDMRGHGRSSKPDAPYRWPAFGEDLAALAREFGWRGMAGAGHSMGGHSLVSAAFHAPGLFSELLLIDPVILPRFYYGGAPVEPHFARKRRARWRSPEEMIERFQDRPPFAAWDRAVLRDYCTHGLLPAEDGDGFVLACPPAIEAEIYENSRQPETSLWDRIHEVEASVTVLRSGKSRMALEGPMEMASSPTAPDLAAHFRQGRDIEVDYSHFIPMEAPDLVAGHLRTNGEY